MAALITLLTLALAAAASAAPDLPSLNIKGPITVSGISAGGFAAVQYHVSFSSEVNAAAVFAGGPFDCADGELTNAEIHCMSGLMPPTPEQTVAKTNKYAQQNEIDSPNNLKNSTVYLYSGLVDNTVKQKVMKALEGYYQQYTSKVTSVFDHLSNHGVPTVNFGVPCVELKSPFLLKCNYDGAGAALKTIRPGLKAAVDPVSANLQEFNQGAFSPVGSHLDSTGFVYVPTACKGNATCSLHIDFHGCQQGREELQQTYVANVGYNGYAEANNIVVLYPQAVKALGSNPEGCFDWWGYTNAKYPTRDGVQNAAVKKMADHLRGAK